MAHLAKITPFLWFKNQQAEEALKFYIDVFGQGEIINVLRYQDDNVGPIGGFMCGVLSIFGQELCALNGNPAFDFSPAFSMLVACESQAEIDRYWDALLEGGQTMACGWITDKFGISWQITPHNLTAMIADPEKGAKVMASMMTMIKLDMPTLEAAFNS